jgi:hypothetical protein
MTQIYIEFLIYLGKCLKDFQEQVTKLLEKKHSTVELTNL